LLTRNAFTSGAPRVVPIDDLPIQLLQARSAGAKTSPRRRTWRTGPTSDRRPLRQTPGEAGRGSPLPVGERPAPWRAQL